MEGLIDERDSMPVIVRLKEADASKFHDLRDNIFFICLSFL